jgi:chromosome segregation ATPase
MKKIFIFLAFTGCLLSCDMSRKTYSSANTSARDDAYVAQDADKEHLAMTEVAGRIGLQDAKRNSSANAPAGRPKDLTQNVESISRLIIYKAQLKMTFRETDTLMNAFDRIAKYHGGYVQFYNDERATIKVLTDRLNAALEDIEQLGKVTSKTVRAQDITTEYNDLEIALDNAEKSRIRYLELLQKAQNVNEMLQVERELERINRTIDRLKGQLQNYDSRIQFAEITVQIHKKVKPGVIGYVGVGLWKGVRWLFVR